MVLVFPNFTVSSPPKIETKKKPFSSARTVKPLTLRNKNFLSTLAGFKKKDE